VCRRVAGLLPRLLLVIFFVEAGLLLLVLPWSGFWERNYFLQAWPQVQPLFANAYIRGGVSGIGVLNLAAALVEFGRALAGRE
jgi:hypothetical protein